MMQRENKVWYLKKSRLFDRATDDVVKNAEHIFTQIMYPKRTLVFEQGDVGRLVYLVKSGRVRIYRATEDGKAITLALLGPGDLFGEEVAFSEVLRTTFAVCVHDSLLCSARGDDLYGLMARNPVLALNVAKYLREQRDDALCVVEDLATYKVPERVMRLLRRLVAEHGVEADGGSAIDLPLTHADIASLVGSTRETVTLQLKELALEKRIRFDGRKIIVMGLTRAEAAAQLT